MRILARFWPDCQPYDQLGDRADFWLNRASRTVQCPWGNDKRSSPPDHLPTTSRSIYWKWNSFEILVARCDTPAHYACANINICGRRRWRVGLWNFWQAPVPMLMWPRSWMAIPTQLQLPDKFLSFTINNMDNSINNCWLCACVRVCVRARE